MDFLNTGNDVEQSEEKDVVGGFKALVSDIYPLTIKMAYFDKSAGGANNITIVCETEDGTKFTSVEWLTNKKGENFFIDKKDKKTKRIMPGLQKLGSLVELLTGAALKESPVEERHVKVYNYDKRAEEAVPRKVLVDLKDVKCQAAIREILETKMEKDSDGKYTIATAETRGSNEVEKWMTDDGLTFNEQAKKLPATFATDWSDAYKGKVRDKTHKGGGAKAGSPKAANKAKSAAPALDLD